MALSEKYPCPYCKKTTSRSEGRDRLEKRPFAIRRKILRRCYYCRRRFTVDVDQPIHKLKEKK